MILYPAIDMLDGQAVRLRQGKRDDVTVFGDPVELAQRWRSKGAQWLHLVDLTAAFEGKTAHLPLIREVVKAFDGRVIKHISENGRKAARWYYDRHHRHINDLCDRHSRVLFFDMHSYSDAIIPPFARRPGTETPDLCIGTDPRFTPKQLKDTVQGLFAQAGFSTGENTPYEGLYVPENILAGQSGCDFIGIMLEFNRRVYCTPAGQTDKARVTLIRSLIGRVLADCINL